MTRRRTQRRVKTIYSRRCTQCGRGGRAPLAVRLFWFFCATAIMVLAAIGLAAVAGGVLW